MDRWSQSLLTLACIRFVIQTETETETETTFYRLLSAEGFWNKHRGKYLILLVNNFYKLNFIGFNRILSL